ncbi:hypothetical protein WDU94_015615 [Cyamophila willieti]
MSSNLSLNIFYQNVQSVNNKLKILNCGIPLTSYDVFIFTETWLKDHVFDSELGFYDHLVYRCDRDSIASNKTKGGGVLLAIKKSLNSQLLNTFTNKSVETLFILVKYKNINIVINATYVEPTCSHDEYQEYTELIDSTFLKYPDAKKYVIGDFNLSHLQWFPCEDTNYLQFSNSNPLSDIFLGSMAFNGLFQINYRFNDLNRLLDLVFVNDPTTIIHPVDDDDALVRVEGHHPVFTVSSTITVTRFTPPYEKREIYCFSKCNFTGLNNYFRDIRWDYILDSTTLIDSQIENFYKTVRHGISSFVPKITIGNFRYPIWYSKELREKISNKKILHKTYKRSPSVFNYNQFSQARRECKALSWCEYEKYIKDTENEIQINPRKIFTYLRNKKHSNIQPVSLTLDNLTSNDSEESANLFARHFATVYSDETIVPPEPNVGKTLLSPLPIVVLRESNVLNKLKKLKASSSAGPDGVPTILLKECAAVLSAPLTMLFQRSLTSGIFPGYWRTSYVVPLHKSGSKTNVKQFRPIGKLSAIPKLFESLVCDEIQPTLSSVIANNQHGFLRHRSTLTSLLCLYQHLTTILEDRNQADCIYTDFSKAYDKVNINILCSKLEAIGVLDPLLSWIRTYLSNRTQIVVYNNAFSLPITVNSGCIQGGHVSGVLFNVFINDLVLNIQGVLGLLFADDFRLARRITGQRDRAALQRALDVLYSWCEVNRMELNVGKCFVMTFQRKHNPLMYRYNLGGVELERIYHVKDLGVTLEPDLKFNMHYNNISNKALRNLGFLARYSHEFSSSKTLRALYISLVRPNLEYCSSLWSPFYNNHITLLERVQRKFLRYLAFRENITIDNHDYSGILEISKLKTLKHRREVADVLFLHKLLHNKINCPELLFYVNLKVQRLGIRHRLLFAPVYYTTNIGTNCPLNRCMSLANIVTTPSLDLDFFTTPTEVLKSKLSDLLTLHQ